jgi:glucosamine--fructose-6-phosphate aminotransferase (isomerizing)
MCGIVCYKGEKDASEVILKGLKKLEYRGYDSAGIATVGNPSIKMAKDQGTIDEVVNENTKLDGKTGIGHTRWATHGEVNQTNAHPHTNSRPDEEHNGRVAVVHNGIINNYAELKKELGEHRFESETDTEVIPHLIEKELEKTDDLKEVCENVTERIEGNYAVVAILDTGEVLAFRKGSPLVVGVEKQEIFLASDVTAFLEHTEKAIFLEDGDYMVIEDEHQIFNSGERIEREPKDIEWEAEEASKQGYDHFMEKEIEEQPKTVKRAAFQDKGDLNKAVEMLDDAEDIYLTGCGTSSYAASLGAKYLREAGYQVHMEQSHELEYRAEEIGEEDLVIAFSQSGETADLLSLLEEVDSELLAVINVVGSTLDRESDHSLYINAGPEIGVASTKAFTGQMTVLKLLMYVSKGEIEEGRKSLLTTADKIENVIENNRKTVEDLSKYIAEKDDVYFIGRNCGFDIAKESALKLKELSYIHAEAFPGGEFKHGTLALVEEGVPVVGFLKETGREDMLSNITEAKSRGADVIGVGENEIDGFEYFVEIPEDPNSEILEVVPFQLLAYKTSVARGNQPDRPRNLAKSVTVK